MTKLLIVNPQIYAFSSCNLINCRKIVLRNFSCRKSKSFNFCGKLKQSCKFSPFLLEYLNLPVSKMKTQKEHLILDRKKAPTEKIPRN